MHEALQLRAQSAAVALRCVYNRFEKEYLDKKPSTVPTGQIVLQYVRPPPPCQYDEYGKSKGRYDERRQAFIHTCFIESVAVRPFRQVCQQIVAPLVDGSEKIEAIRP